MNKTIDLDRLGIKQLSLTVVPNIDESADACPQVVEFYKNALISETAVEHFKNIPFNKWKKRIPKVTTGSVLAGWNCSFSDKVTADLSAKEVEVEKLSVMMEICISDIEDSFLVDRMTQGQNNPVNPQEFLNYLWGHIGEQAGEDVEILRWNGDKTKTTDALLKLADGYTTILEADKLLGMSAIATHVASVVVTEANVIAELYRTLKAVPAKFRRSTGANELKIFVSSNIALAFQVATSQYTAVGGYVTNTGDMFLGRYKIIEVPVLADNTMVLSPKEDIIYSYDLLNDKDNFKVVDMLDTAAEPKVRFRVNLAVGFDFDELQNVVYYSPVSGS